jgi:hypothetical protein
LVPSNLVVALAKLQTGTLKFGNDAVERSWFYSYAQL